MPLISRTSRKLIITELVDSIRRDGPDMHIHYKKPKNSEQENFLRFLTFFFFFKGPPH